MNDQEKSAEFVRQQNVTYVVVFTGYYQDFLKPLNAQLVYSPEQTELKTLGWEPFEVFQIGNP